MKTTTNTSATGTKGMTEEQMVAACRNLSRGQLVMITYDAGRKPSARALADARATSNTLVTHFLGMIAGDVSPAAMMMRALLTNLPKNVYLAQMCEMFETGNGAVCLRAFVLNRGTEGQFRTFSPTVGALRSIVAVGPAPMQMAA